MFRNMRRINQQLPMEETIAIFENGTSGTLALLGDDGYPYTVPINYVYSDGNIYFHSATEGHKIDAIRNYDKASFCVVDADDVVPEEFTTYFRSAIAFGRIKLIEDGDRKHSAIQMLAEKYSSDQGARIEHVINQYANVLTMIELEIEHMTG
ncbi:MAG: pyridoxamine 5'-phosphate oxidase family protein, partial [Eubacteriales bacterium]|nr:pyridoxamine 5'-phosphate oxidase family protein [Eubacteriales bacterium]